MGDLDQIATIATRVFKTMPGWFCGVVIGRNDLETAKMFAEGWITFTSRQYFGIWGVGAFHST